MDATDLDSLAHNLLDACIAALDTLPTFGLDGAPSRAFVSPGQPALDCCDDGQLTVQASLIVQAPTTPGGLDAGKRPWRGTINHVTLTIVIARCIPVSDDQGNPLPPEVLDAVAEQTNADAWALSNDLFWTAGSWSEVMTDSSSTLACGEVFFDGFRPLPPSSCGGWTGIIRVRLDGYQVTP